MTAAHVEPAACRPGCGACCIAPSISSPIPGRDGRPPAPKPAGQPCIQLDAELRCRLFGRPERPAVCASLQPGPAMCGDTPAAAMQWLTRLECQTQPARRP
ncbi:MAG: YkgJ family cysteine cluster protein [Rubrivivax sp.]|nr:YkgJ family cysteine cluster protein [Rubrivivax sp.]